MQKMLSKNKIKEPDTTTPYYKLILIGENEVGKTQILHRFNDENFEDRYSPTFGIDFRVKSFFGDKGKLLYDIQIIDIAGETDQIHTRIEGDFINDANAFVCLFNLSDDYSLDRAITIMEKYKQLVGEKSKFQKWYLIGNKKDIDINKKGVPYYLKAKFDNYFEVSCKTSKKEEFQKIIEAITYDIEFSKKENDKKDDKKKKKIEKILDKDEKEDKEDNEEGYIEPKNFDIDFKSQYKDLFNEECNII